MNAIDIPSFVGSVRKGLVQITDPNIGPFELSDHVRNLRNPLLLSPQNIRLTPILYDRLELRVVSNWRRRVQQDEYVWPFFFERINHTLDVVPDCFGRLPAFIVTLAVGSHDKHLKAVSRRFEEEDGKSYDRSDGWFWVNEVRQYSKYSGRVFAAYIVS